MQFNENNKYLTTPKYPSAHHNITHPHHLDKIIVNLQLNIAFEVGSCQLGYLT